VARRVSESARFTSATSEACELSGLVFTFGLANRDQVNLEDDDKKALYKLGSRPRTTPSIWHIRLGRLSKAYELVGYTQGPSARAATTLAAPAKH